MEHERVMSHEADLQKMSTIMTTPPLVKKDSQTVERKNESKRAVRCHTLDSRKSFLDSNEQSLTQMGKKFERRSTTGTMFLRSVGGWHEKKNNDKASSVDDFNCNVGNATDLEFLIFSGAERRASTGILTPRWNRRRVDEGLLSRGTSTLNSIQPNDCGHKSKFSKILEGEEKKTDNKMNNVTELRLDFTNLRPMCMVSDKVPGPNGCFGRSDSYEKFFNKVENVNTKNSMWPESCERTHHEFRQQEEGYIGLEATCAALRNNANGTAGVKAIINPLLSDSIRCKRGLNIPDFPSNSPSAIIQEDKKVEHKGSEEDINPLLSDSIRRTRGLHLSSISPGCCRANSKTGHTDDVSTKDCDSKKFNEAVEEEINVSNCAHVENISDLILLRSGNVKVEGRNAGRSWKFNVRPNHVQFRHENDGCELYPSQSERRSITRRSTFNFDLSSIVGSEPTSSYFSRREYEARTNLDEPSLGTTSPRSPRRVFERRATTGMLIPPMIDGELQSRRLKPAFMMFPRHEGRVNDISFSTPTVECFEHNRDQPIASVSTLESSRYQASGSFER